MDQPLLLAIDVGLTNAKAVLFDGNGVMRARTSVLYPTRRTGPDAVEQDPSAWWGAIAEAVRGLDTDLRKQVMAMGVTAHMHALVALGRDLRPIGPSLVLGDRRGAHDATAISERVGPHEVYSITGAELDASMPAAKARYMSRRDPDAWGDVTCLLGCKDYVRYLLTGELASEPIDACATSLYDIRSGKWSEPLLEAAGVRLEQLPPIVLPWEMAGAVLPDVASTLGLRVGTPVAVGAGDDVVVLGFGVLEPGVAIEALGTTGSMMAVTDRLVSDPDRRLELYPHVLPGRWVVGGSHTTAGAALSWAAELLGYDSVGAALVALDLPSSNGVAFLPSFAGERFPARVPQARGAWLGLGLDVTRETLMRAAFEGVASSLAAILVRIDELGTHQNTVRVARADNERWLALRGATYGRRLEVARTTEPTALGLACLVAVVGGLHSDVTAAVGAMTSIDRTLDVDASAQANTAVDTNSAVLRQTWAQIDQGRAEMASIP
jgi:xylulokinase